MAWSLAGSGAAGDPWQVSSVADYLELCDSANSAYWASGNHFALTTDLDLSGQATAPIGTYVSATDTFTYFAGEFDGQDFTISNSIVSSDEPYQGAVFGPVTGVVKNLRVLDCALSDVSSAVFTTYTGALCGLLDGGTVQDCHVTWATVNATFTSGSRAAHFMGGAQNGASVARCSLRVTGSAGINGLSPALGGRIAGFVGPILGTGATFTDCLVWLNTTQELRAKGYAAGFCCECLNTGTLAFTRCTVVMKNTTLSISQNNSCAGFVGYVGSTGAVDIDDCHVIMIGSTVKSTSSHSYVSPFVARQGDGALSITGCSVQLDGTSLVTTGGGGVGVILGGAPGGTSLVISDTCGYIKLGGIVRSSGTANTVGCFLGVSHVAAAITRSYVCGSGQVRSGAAGTEGPFAGTLYATLTPSASWIQSTLTLTNMDATVDSSTYCTYDSSFIANADYSGYTALGNTDFVPSSSTHWHPRGLSNNAPALLTGYPMRVLFTESPATSVLGSLSVTGSSYPFVYTVELTATGEMTVGLLDLSAEPSDGSYALEAPAAPPSSWGVTLTSSASGYVAWNEDARCYYPCFTVDGAALLGLTTNGSGQYQIDTARKMAHVGGLTGIGTWMDQSFAVTADVDVGGFSCRPIGASGDKFTGTFEGGNHTVSNVRIGYTPENYRGLFGQADGCAIQNLRIDGFTDEETAVDRSGGTVVGTITTAGADALVDNVHVSLASSIDEDAGNVGAFIGLANWASSGTLTISSCSVRLSNMGITGTSNTSLFCAAGRSVQCSDCLIVAESVTLTATTNAGSGIITHCQGTSADPTSFSNVTVVLKDCTMTQSSSASRAITPGVSYIDTGYCSLTGVRVYLLGSTGVTGYSDNALLLGASTAAVTISDCFTYLGPNASMVSSTSRVGPLVDAITGGTSTVSDCHCQIEGTLTSGSGMALGLVANSVSGAVSVTASRCNFSGGGELTDATGSTGSVFVGYGSNYTLSDCYWSAGLTLTGWGSRTTTNDGTCFEASADLLAAAASGPTGFVPAAADFFNPNGGLTDGAPALLRNGPNVYVFEEPGLRASPLGAVFGSFGAYPVAVDLTYDTGTTVSARALTLAAPSTYTNQLDYATAASYYGETTREATATVSASSPSGFYLSDWAPAGAGTAGDPWRVTTYTQWLQLCYVGNAARLGDYFELGADILAPWTGTSVTPVGLYSGTAFSGTFNGNGFTMGGFTVTASENAAGIFGYCNGATIYDLNVEEITCVSNSLNYMSAVVGRLDSSSLTNVHYASSSSQLKGRQCGCMVGYVTGTESVVTRCSVHLSGTATVQSPSGNNAGMFAGPAKGTFTDCVLYSDGVGFTGAANYHGGLCGQGVTDVTFVRCTVVLKDCTLKSAGNNVGAIIGRNAAKTTITDCRAFLLGTAKITTPGDSAGGLMGDSSDDTYVSAVTGSFVYVASGATIQAGAWAGALVGAGRTSLAVSDCEVQLEGTVDGQHASTATAGLLVGYSYGTTISRVRAFGAGTVTNSGGPTTAAAHGPFVGMHAGGTTTLTDLQMASDLVFTNCDTAVSGTGVVHNSTIVASSNWRSASATGDTAFAPTSTDYWHPLNGLASDQPAQPLESSVVVDGAADVYAPLGQLQHDLPTPTWVRFSYDAGTETLTVTYKSLLDGVDGYGLPDQTFSAGQYLVALTSNYELSSTTFRVAPGALEMLYNWMSTDSFSLWPTDASGYYQISSVNQLRGIYCFIGLYYNSNFVLTADLDFAGETWGWYATGANATKCLKGTFDGGGFTISNMFFQETGPYGNGLYSLSAGGTVRNLTMDGTVLTSGTCGGLVARVQTGFSATDCRVIHTAPDSSGGYYGGVAAICYSSVTITRFSFLCRADLGRGGYGGGVIGIKQDNGSNFKCINCTVVVDAGCTFSSGEVGGLGGRVLGDMWADHCTVVVGGGLYATTGRAGGLYGYGSGSASLINIVDSSVYVVGTGSVSNASGGAVGGFVGYTNSTLASTMSRNYLYVGPGASLSAPTGTCAPFMGTFLSSALTSEDDRLHVDGTVTGGAQPTGLICGYGSTSSVSVARFQATGSGTLTGSVAGTEGPFVGTGVAQGAVADSFRAASLGGNFDASVSTLTTSFVAAADLQSASTPGASTFVPSSADFFHPRGLAGDRPALLSAARNTVVVESAAAFDTVFGSVAASFGSYPVALHFELTAAGEVTCSADSLAAPAGADDYYSLDAAAATAWGVTTASAASGYTVWRTPAWLPCFTLNGAAALGLASAEGYHQVATARQMAHINGLTGIGTWMSENFVVTASLDMAGYALAGIGAPGSEYGGVFDGQGYALSNLTFVDGGRASGVGLFGCTDGCTIRNVVLSGCDMSAVTLNYSAPLVGLMTCSARDSVVTACHVRNALDVSGGSDVSSFLGDVRGSSGGPWYARISNCSAVASGAITSTAGNAGVFAGGLEWAELTDCLAMCAGGSITAPHSVGGLVGHGSTSTTVQASTVVLDGAAVTCGAHCSAFWGTQDGGGTAIDRCSLYILGASSVTATDANLGLFMGNMQASATVSGNYAFVDSGSWVSGTVGGLMFGNDESASALTVTDNHVCFNGGFVLSSGAAGLVTGDVSTWSGTKTISRNQFSGSGALTSGASATGSVYFGNDDSYIAAIADCWYSAGLTLTGWGARVDTYDGSSFVALADFTGASAPGPSPFVPSSAHFFHPRGLSNDAPAMLVGARNTVVVESAAAFDTVFGSVTAVLESYPAAVHFELSAPGEVTCSVESLAAPVDYTEALDAPAGVSAWGVALAAPVSSGYTVWRSPAWTPCFTVDGAPLLGLAPAGDGAYEIADARTFAHLGGLAGMGSWMAQAFRLTADVDLAGYAPVAPLGTTTHKFTGSFDGGGFRVANASVYSGGGLNANCLGLFGRVSSATLSNLTVADTTVAGGALSYVGGVVGRADSSSIEDVHYESTAASSLGGQDGVGGVMGFAYGSSGASRTLVTRSSARLGGALAAAGNGCGALCGDSENADFTDCLCVVDGAVLSADTGAGGVVGRHAAGASALLRCTSVFRAGSADASTSGAGGVLGQIAYGLVADSSVADCHAFFLDASAYSALGAGGVVGRGGCAVSGCSVYAAPGATVSAASAAGGVFGHAWAGSSVTDCTVQIDGTVSAAGADPDTGVLVGWGKSLTVSRCLALGGGTFENTGATSAAESGPLVGVVDASGAAAAVSDCQLSAGLTLVAMDDSIAGGTLASYESTVRVAADWESVLETGASAFAPASSHFWHPRGLATGAPAALLEQGLVLTGDQSAASPLGAVAAALDAGAFPAWARCSFDGAGAGQATWSFWTLAASNDASGTYEMPAAASGASHVVTTRDYCLGSLFSAAAAAGHESQILYNWAVPGDPAWTQAGDGYLEVASVAQLRALGQYVTVYGGSNFRLTADLDFAGETFGWVPAGHDAAPFAGALDGAGHAVSNLRFEAAGERGSALFGTVTGELRQLTLVGAQFPATGDCAGLATRAASGFVSDGCVVRMTAAHAGSGDFGGLAVELAGDTAVSSFRFEAQADLSIGSDFGGVAARTSGASNVLQGVEVVVQAGRTVSAAAAGGVVGKPDSAGGSSATADVLVAGALTGTIVGGVYGSGTAADASAALDCSVYVVGTGGAVSGSTYAGGLVGAASATGAVSVRRNFVYVGPGATLAGATLGAPFVGHRGNGGATDSEDDRAHLDGTVSSGGQAGLYLTSASGSANALTLSRYQVTGAGAVTGSGPGATPWVGGPNASSSASNCSWAQSVTGVFRSDPPSQSSEFFVASADLQGAAVGACPEDPAHFWHLRALGPQVPPLLRAGKGSTVVVTGTDPFDGGTPLGRVTAGITPVPAALHFTPTHDSNDVLQAVHISAQALGGADPLEPLGAAAWTGALDLLTGSRRMARPVSFTGDVQPAVNGLQAPFPVLGVDSNDRLVLASAPDLQAVGQFGSLQGSNFVLAGPLDMAGAAWYGVTLTGDLDGAGFGVSNLDTSLVLDLGAGSVHDLTLSDPGVAQVPDAGGLVCYAGAGASISNCHVVVSAAGGVALGASNSGSFGWLVGNLDGASVSGCSVRAAAAAATGAGATGALLVGRAGAGASVSNCFCCAEAGVTAGAAVAALVGRLEGASVVADCTALCRGAALQATEAFSYAGMVVGASDGDAAGTCRSNGVYALGAATLASSGAVGAVCGSAPGVVAGNAAFVGAAASAVAPRCGLVAGDAVGASHDLRDNWVRVDGAAAATTMAYPMGLAVGNLGGASALAVRRCIFEGTGTLTSAKDSASSSFFVGNDTAGAAALESNFWGGGLTVTGWGARTATNDGSSFRANADFTGALAAGPAEFGPVAPAGWWHPRGLASNTPAMPADGYRVVLEAGLGDSVSVLGTTTDTGPLEGTPDRVLHVSFAGSNVALRSEALVAPLLAGAVALDALDGGSWAVELPSNPIRVPGLVTSGDPVQVNGYTLPLEPLELQVWTLSNASAYQASDGAVEIAASGGQSNWYTWLWSLDGGAPEAGAAARTVGAGQWTVAASTPDDPVPRSIEATVLDGLGVVVTRYHPSTVGGADGRMEALARGGAGGGGWLWSAGQVSSQGTESTASGLQAGEDVTVTYSEDLPVVTAGVAHENSVAASAAHRLYEPMDSGFEVSDDERVNLLFKKYARSVSTTTASAGLAGEATEMTSRGTVRSAGDVYAYALPLSDPVASGSWTRSGSTVTTPASGAVDASAESAAALASAHGLTEDIWQAFKDGELEAAHGVQGTDHVVQLEHLATRHVTSTPNIGSSPSFYHPCLFDAVPPYAFGRFYGCEVTGYRGAGADEVRFTSTDDGAWTLQPESGVIQFMDAAATTGGVALFDAGSDEASDALFNLAKTPRVTFYRYVGPRLDEFLTTISRDNAYVGDGAVRLWTDSSSNARFDVTGGVALPRLTADALRLSNDAALGAGIALEAETVRTGPVVLGNAAAGTGIYDVDGDALVTCAGDATTLFHSGQARLATTANGVTLCNLHARDVRSVQLNNLEAANMTLLDSGMTLGFDYNYYNDSSYGTTVKSAFTAASGGLVGRTAAGFRALYHTENLAYANLAVAQCAFASGAAVAGDGSVLDVTQGGAGQAWLGWSLGSGASLLQNAANQRIWGLYRSRGGQAALYCDEAGAQVRDEAGTTRATVASGAVQFSGNLQVTGDAVFDDVTAGVLTMSSWAGTDTVSDKNNAMSHNTYYTIRSWTVTPPFNTKYHMSVSGSYFLHLATQTTASAAASDNPTQTGIFLYSKLTCGSTSVEKIVRVTEISGNGPQLLPISLISGTLTQATTVSLAFKHAAGSGVTRYLSVYDACLVAVPVTTV